MIFYIFVRKQKSQVRERVFVKATGFVEQQIGEETVLVPLVESVAKMQEVFTLNELGTFVYELLEKKMAFQELLSNVVNSYDVSAEEAHQDLQQFLLQALNKKVIIEI
ncbi:PqqD family protein [Marinilabiliaceae bacterium JC017]|nr:PqqD family protein [Marinilabiliaceae bacterium JC017]